MRLFIAVNVNEATRSALASLQTELRTTAARGRFSAQENLHLTLVFLGECDPTQTAAARSAVERVRFSSFPLIIDRLGRFRRDGGEIWWAGVEASEPLLALQRNLTKALQVEGFQLESRKYMPHITLARELVTTEKEKTISPFGETVTKIDLMKSEYIQGKLTYTAIYSIQG